MFISIDGISCVASGVETESWKHGVRFVSCGYGAAAISQGALYVFDAEPTPTGIALTSSGTAHTCQQREASESHIVENREIILRFAGYFAPAAASRMSTKHYRKTFSASRIENGGLGRSARWNSKRGLCDFDARSGPSWRHPKLQGVGRCHCFRGF